MVHRGNCFDSRDGGSRDDREDRDGSVLRGKRCVGAFCHCRGFPTSTRSHAAAARRLRERCATAVHWHQSDGRKGQELCRGKVFAAWQPLQDSDCHGWPEALIAEHRCGNKKAGLGRNPVPAFLCLDLQNV
jgi:hypothetical protein